MRKYQKGNAVASRAEKTGSRLPAGFLLLALAMALFVGLNGMARAEGFNATAEEKAQLPDSVRGKPGADRIPPGLACPDNMDLTPQDNLPSPFDAELVSWRGAPMPMPIADQSGCPDRRLTRARTV